LHPSTLAKRVYLLLFAIIIAFYLYGLGKLPLLGPDEPRYAQVAREMFVTGDLITPTLGHHTWFEKPALLYWMIAAAFKVFGVSEWSARLGPALCGLLTIAAVWCVGREIDREDPRGFAFWSVVVTASCLGLIVFSRAASFDVVITMTTTWSLAFFVMHELRHKRSLLAGFYVFVGLSLLAKGLVGIVIPFGVVGLYYLLRRAWPSRAVWLSLFWGVPLALAVSAIWYGPVIARHGWTFIDEFFIQHHFARYMSNKYHHPQPIYFYPVIILMLALPWTPYLILALAKVRGWTWRGGDSLSIVRVFSLAWLLLPLVFFSFSGSKLPGYVLPVVPAVALLVSDRLTRALDSKWPLVIAGATAVLVVIVLNFGAMRYARQESVRDLLMMADARGYAGAPVLAQRSDDRSAEFYASARVLYGRDGEPVTFDEITVDQARALGGKFVVMIPVEYLNNVRGVKTIEIIGDNGKTAALGWKP
jgi:4-amino-4-deoxy-L-arabinose transferase-like glycosyltransferase